MASLARPLLILSAAPVAVALAELGMFGPVSAALLGLGLAGAGLAAGAPPAASPAGPAPAPAPALPGEALLAAIPDPLLIVRDGIVARANPAAEALLGSHIERQDVRLAIRHPAAAERLASGDDGPPVPLAGLGSADRRWELDTAALPGGGRLVRLIDRTGLHAAERMRVDFVANASHELRTPLANLLGYIETLDDDAGADAATRTRFLGIMLGEARRMHRLVDDLISLSRIEADRFTPPRTQVDLHPLLEEVFATFPDARQRLRADVQPALPAIMGDRTQLSQVLHNLIGNALKYGRADRPVTVTLAAAPEGWVALEVADEGDGIAAEHLPRLTERFYRVDPGRSRAAGGTGLGLAIVKHIVERHRGRLEIRSTVGSGTSVRVLLPAAAEPPLS